MPLMRFRTQKRLPRDLNLSHMNQWHPQALFNATLPHHNNKLTWNRVWQMFLWSFVHTGAESNLNTTFYEGY